MLSLLCALLVVAADDTPLSRATAAYEKKDYASFLTKMREAAVREPNRPRVLLALASAQALGGAEAEVAGTLKRVAAMGLYVDALKDDDFAHVRHRADVKAAASALASNRTPRGAAAVKPLFALPEAELAEGVAFDEAKQRFLVANYRRRAVIAVDAKTFVATPFARLETGGPLGISIDAKRKVAWVTTAVMPQDIGYVAADKFHSALHTLDLANGAVLKTWALETSEPHVLGDVIVASNGDAFATDSLQPTVYRVSQGEVTKWAQGPFRSLQGLAFSKDERQLYLADYSLGLFVVDVATKAVTAVALPGDVAAVGIDGLYFASGVIIAAQNGVEPQRVMAFTLDPKGLKVTKQRVVLSGVVGVDDLSLGVMTSPTTLVLNAQAGWAAFDDSGALKGERAPPVKFVSVSLK